MRYAVQNGKAERDVTADLSGALPSPQVKHMASFVKSEQVGELLRAIDGFRGTFTVECALRLSPLVFTRPSELRRAKWADIDLSSGFEAYRVSRIMNLKKSQVFYWFNRRLIGSNWCVFY